MSDLSPSGKVYLQITAKSNEMHNAKCNVEGDNTLIILTQSFSSPSNSCTTGKVCDSMEKHSVHLQQEAYLCSADNDSPQYALKVFFSVHSWDACVDNSLEIQLDL